jgi:hypothetical protein
MSNGNSLEQHYVWVIIAGVVLAIALIIVTRPQPSVISNYPFPTAATPPPYQGEATSNSPASSSLIFANLTPDGKFDTLVQHSLYPDERGELAAETQQAFDYVSKSFDVQNLSRFKAAFVIDENCTLHGITRADEGVAQVYTCNSISRSQAISIMAHELAHQLQFEQYGKPHLTADQILVEGMATWAAGEYWLGGQPDFRAYVRAQRMSSGLEPLATAVTREDFDAMNRLYYPWASFVDFLIDTYGRPKFNQLYVTGHITAGSADYVGVYGKDLKALEREWQAWLDG